MALCSNSALFEVSSCGVKSPTLTSGRSCTRQRDNTLSRFSSFGASLSANTAMPQECAATDSGLLTPERTQPVLDNCFNSNISSRLSRMIVPICKRSKPTPLIARHADWKTSMVG